MFLDAITGIFAGRRARIELESRRLREEREALEARKSEIEQTVMNSVRAMTKPETEYLEKLKKEAKELRRVCDLCVLALHDVGMVQLSMELQKEVDKGFGEKK